jgi:hypothetical protein
MSEIHEVSTPIGQLVRPVASEPRGYKFQSRSGKSFAKIFKNEKTKKSHECFAELILEINDPFSLSKVRRRQETEFIEWRASTNITSKSTLAENGEKVSKDSSKADAAVCKHGSGQLTTTLMWKT